jgi:hypothetical protein
VERVVRSIGYGDVNSTYITLCMVYKVVWSINWYLKGPYQVGISFEAKNSPSSSLPAPAW